MRLKTGRFRPQKSRSRCRTGVNADNLRGLYASVWFSSTPQDRTVPVNIAVSLGFLTLEVADSDISAYIRPRQMSDP